MDNIINFPFYSEHKVELSELVKMTLTDLNAILNWTRKESHVLLSEFVSVIVKQVLNINSNAEFLLLHFLNEWMSQNSDTMVPIVVFVTFSYAPHHYYHIERKMGIDLDRWIKKEQRMILVDATQCFNKHTSNSNLSSFPIFQCHTSNSQEFFKTLNMFILEQMQTLKRGYSDSTVLIPLLVIDDLTVLYHAGYSINAMMIFVRQFMKYMEEVSGYIKRINRDKIYLELNFYDSKMVRF
jgi:hypothetical protein